MESKDFLVYLKELPESEAIKIIDNMNSEANSMAEKLNNLIIAPLFMADFSECWISLKLTGEQMAGGFHAGNVKIDLSGVR